MDKGRVQMKVIIPQSMGRELSIPFFFETITMIQLLVGTVT